MCTMCLYTLCIGAVLIFLSEYLSVCTVCLYAQCVQYGSVYSVYVCTDSASVCTVSECTMCTVWMCVQRVCVRTFVCLYSVFASVARPC